MYGMNALRNRCEERKRLIKYDSQQISVWTRYEWKMFERYLKKHCVKCWYYNGDLFTYDDRFGELLNDWLFDRVDA